MILYNNNTIKLPNLNSFKIRKFAYCLKDNKIHKPKLISGNIQIIIKLLEYLQKLKIFIKDKKLINHLEKILICTIIHILLIFFIIFKSFIIF